MVKTAGGHLAKCPPLCGTDPSMLITVTGGVTSTITWCGETWNLPGDSGVQKEVCPTFYVINHYYNIFVQAGEGTYVADEIWRQAGLELSRGVLANWTTSFNIINGDNQRNELQLSPSGTLGFNKRDISLVDVRLGTWPTPNIASVSPNLATFSLGLISGEALPRYDGVYRLVGTFFNSYTLSGVTYIWEKGDGW